MFDVPCQHLLGAKEILLTAFDSVADKGFHRLHLRRLLRRICQAMSQQENLSDILLRGKNNRTACDEPLDVNC